jgi:hypothetical protein
MFHILPTLALGFGSIVFIIIIIVWVLSTIFKKSQENTTPTQRKTRRRGGANSQSDLQSLEELSAKRREQLLANQRGDHTAPPTSPPTSSPAAADGLSYASAEAERQRSLAQAEAERQQTQAEALKQDRTESEFARGRQAALQAKAQESAEAALAAKREAALAAQHETELGEVDQPPQILERIPSLFTTSSLSPSEFAVEPENLIGTQADAPIEVPQELAEAPQHAAKSKPDTHNSFESSPQTPSLETHESADISAAVSGANSGSEATSGGNSGGGGDFIEAILGADRFGGERDQLVAGFVGQMFQLELEVTSIDRTLASGLDKQFRNGRTVVGKLTATDRPVAVFFDETLNERIENLSTGTRLSVRGAFQKWDDFYERPQMLGDQLET